MIRRSFPAVCRRGLACVSLGLLLGALTLPAEAHPSDFETLTLDLLIGVEGLRWVDAAVVESGGPGHEPFPTAGRRHDVAVGVLEALEMPLDHVEIDAEGSARYHEVGFLIEFPRPFLDSTSDLRIDTSDFQRLTADAGLERLKLSVCGASQDPDSADPDVLAGLDVSATQPGRSPAGIDRPGCEVWTLTPADTAVTITVSEVITLDTRRNTTLIAGTVALAAVVADVALLFGALKRRRRGVSAA